VLSDLNGRRVLVIGINYWPEQTGIAPYTTGMAEYLVDQGAAVKVITGIPHYPSWRVPARYRWRAVSPEWRRGVEVRRLRHYVPRHMTAAGRAAYEATFLLHVVLRTFREKPDLVLAVSPALGGALAGVAVARRRRCPLLVVVQDLMAKATEQSGMSGGARLTTLAARAEGAALRAASLVAVVSDSFQGAVEAYGVPAHRVAVLRNWTHISTVEIERTEARKRLNWPVETFLALHTGNMGYKQDLGNVIDAARLLCGSGIEVMLIGNGSQRAALERYADGLGNVRFLDLVDSTLYPLVLAAADVLLVNERSSVGEMSLPSKITSYLAAGQAIIAAVSAGGASERELRRTNGAALIVAPGRPEALAASLRYLKGNQDSVHSMGSAASTYAAGHLTRESALRVLSELLIRISRPVSPC
jgi:colanic acid biosynthesis glycosyl transferase WcaI